MDGLFVQYFLGDRLITLPVEEGNYFQEDAWVFEFTEDGNQYEIYSKREYVMDATGYTFYRKDYDTEVGYVEKGGRYMMFPPLHWRLRELEKEFGHRTRLPFIVIFGTRRERRIRMPESGDEIFRLIEAGLCKKIYFIAGFKEFLPCETKITKEEGCYELEIIASGETVYRSRAIWNFEKNSFADYQNQISHPWKIDDVYKRGERRGLKR